MTFVSAGMKYTDNTLLTPEEQNANICGSLLSFSAHEHDRAWGLFAYPNNAQSLTLQTNVTSQCFAYGRKYGPGRSHDDVLAKSPYLQNSNSVTGGACNDTTLPCYNLVVTGQSTKTNVRYFPVPYLNTLMDVGPGEWGTIQMYKFVTGAYRTTATTGPRWDCTSAAWQAHYTTIPETYCWNDFLSALNYIAPGTIVADPATVAQAWTPDTTPPGTTITSGPAAVTTDTAATFAFTSGDARSWYACGLDGAPLSVCVSGVAFSNLQQGIHTFRVQASDAYGNADVATWVWTVQTPATVELNPSSLEFGTQAVGTWSNPQEVTLTNAGGSSLIITTVTLAGTHPGDYEISDDCVASSPLAPGATCRTTVIFSPKEVGERPATVVYTSSAPEGPHTVPLIGVGE